MKLRYLLTVAFISILGVPSISLSEKWVREGSGLLFPLDVANVDVVRVGDSGTAFRAYYMKPGAIYSAVSQDDGVSFVEEGMVLSGEHPAAVKLSDGRIRLYYTDSSSGDFVSAITSDGTTFSQEDGVRLSTSQAGRKIVHPHVVAVPTGGYRLYYDQELENHPVGFGKNILSLYSEDGLTWVREKGVRIGKKISGFAKLNKPGPVFSPFAMYRNGKVLIYFTAENDNKQKKSGVWIAQSRDGKKFTVLSKALGIDPAVSDPTAGQGGLTGNPQDTFIITTSTGSKRMYIWQAQEGIYSAIPQ